MLFEPSNQNLIIRSIRKGWGQGSAMWEVGAKYARIEPNFDVVGWDGESARKQLVYLIYDHKQNLVVKIESDSQLLITYYRLAEEEVAPPDAPQPQLLT